MNAHPHCKSVLVPVQPRRAYFQPCPDAMPVEVVVQSRTGEVVVVEAKHGTPFQLLTTFGYLSFNVAPVYLAHVKLLEIKHDAG